MKTDCSVKNDSLQIKPSSLPLGYGATGQPCHIFGEKIDHSKNKISQLKVMFNSPEWF